MRDFSHGEKSLALLEKPLLALRVAKIKKYLKRGETIIDLGCGYNAFFLHALQKQKKFKFLIGIDARVKKVPEGNRVILKEGNLDERLNLSSQSTDVVTSLAVLEHLNNPQRHLDEAYRILQNGGRFLLTTPTPLARPILEFLSFKLHLVDRAEIIDHKNYYNLRELKAMLLRSGFEWNKIKLSKFMFGLNNFVVCTK